MLSIFLSVLFHVTGSELLVATSTDAYYFRKEKTKLLNEEGLDLTVHDSIDVTLVFEHHIIELAKKRVSKMFSANECQKCQRVFKSLLTHMKHVCSQHCILRSDSTMPLQEKVPH